MAKRQRKAAPAALAAAASACSLREIPSTPDFEATTGAKVKLVTHDHVGVVLIAKAEYAGQQLVPGGQALSTITFTVLAGRNTLKLVFVFSASMTSSATCIAWSRAAVSRSMARGGSPVDRASFCPSACCLGSSAASS